MRILLAFALALPTFAFAGEGHDHGHSHSHEEHAEEKHAHELHLGHGWMAATNDDTARAFINIENEGDEEIKLAAFKADWATAELRGAPLRADGSEIPLINFPLAAGEKLEMTPESIYVRFTNLTAPATEGEERVITLILEDGDEFEIEIEVEGANAENESHAGHNH